MGYGNESGPVTGILKLSNPQIAQSVLSFNMNAKHNHP